MAEDKKLSTTSDFEEYSEGELDEFGEVLVTWKFPEYEDITRGKGWYIIGSIVVALLMVWSYFDKNPLFALIVAVGAMMTIFLARKKPEIIDIFITDTGVIIGDTFLQYKDLKDFAIVYDPPEVKKLYIETRSTLRPRLSIALEDINPLVVREVLLEYLDEDLEREEEASSEALTRLFKL